MKNLKQILSLSALFCASVLSAQSINDLKKDILSEDVHVADAARMAMEKYSDQQAGEKALIESLSKVKNNLVKSGVIYSLGDMESKKAKSAIEKFVSSDDENVANAARLALKQLGVKKVSSLKPALKEDSAIAIYDNADTPKVGGRIANADNDRILEVIALVGKSDKDSAKKSLEVAIDKDMNVNLVQNAFALSTNKHLDDVIRVAVAKDRVFAVAMVGNRMLVDQEEVLLAKIADFKNTQLQNKALDSLKTIGSKKSIDFFFKKLAQPDCDKNFIAATVRTLPTILNGQNKAQLADIEKQVKAMKFSDLAQKGVDRLSFETYKFVAPISAWQKKKNEEEAAKKKAQEKK